MIRTCGDDQGRDFEARTGIDGSTLSRWKKGESGGLRADKVAAFARGYGVPVLEAFVEAGFLSSDEAGAAVPGKPDLDSITDDELIELVRQRLQRAGGEHGRSSAPIAHADLVVTQPDGSMMIIEAKGPTGDLAAGVEQVEAMRQQLEQQLSDDYTVVIFDTNVLLNAGLPQVPKIDWDEFQRQLEDESNATVHQLSDRSPSVPVRRVARRVTRPPADDE